MPDRRAALLQGTLDLLILKALSTGELHGLGVSRRVGEETARWNHIALAIGRALKA